MTIRERTEELEKQTLSAYAQLSIKSGGRLKPEPECDIRTCFQRDVDRITYSKAFRRLKHKTQVFLKPEGDHYRTRLTHTLEVSRIARTIARSLRLNEDLTEAISLGHDLGHTPFGHAGEQALNEIVPGGFSHNGQSLHVVEVLENDGRGLNLTFEVRDGILNHCGGGKAQTLEGRVVHFADRIGYISHDIDDAIRAGILKNGDIPEKLRLSLGDTHSKRIDALVRDIIAESTDKDDICMSGPLLTDMLTLREFLFERVYRNPTAKGEESKARDILKKLYCYYTEHVDELPADQIMLSAREGVERVVCDYIAGMTDHFAVSEFARVFVPKGWEIL
jgi:dGTPase